MNFLLRAAQLFHLLSCQLEKNQIQLNWNHYRMFILFYFLTLRKNTLVITLKIFHYSCKDQVVGRSTQRHSRGLWGTLIRLDSVASSCCSLTSHCFGFGLASTVADTVDKMILKKAQAERSCGRELRREKRSPASRSPLQTPISARGGNLTHRAPERQATWRADGSELHCSLNQRLS